MMRETQGAGIGTGLVPEGATGLPTHSAPTYVPQWFAKAPVLHPALQLILNPLPAKSPE